MSNNEHREGADAHRAFRCTFGPVRERDLVWPPPDEDMDAFSVVHLDVGDQQEAAPKDEAALAVVARPRYKPTFGDCRDPGLAPRIRPLVVPMEPPALSVHEQPDELVTTDVAPAVTPSPAEGPMVFPHVVEAASRDPELTGARRSAWLAVFFAAACALVTVVEYRAIFSVPADAGAVAEQPPVPEGVSATDLAPGVPRVVRPSARRTEATARKTEPPAQRTAKLDKKVEAPARQAAAAPVRPTPAPAPKVTPIAPAPPVDRSRLAAASPVRAVGTPEPTVSRVAVAVLDRGTVPVPASIPSPSASSAPVPVTTTAALPDTTTGATAAGAPRPVAAVLTAAVHDDEADIRSTLSRFRTAYSQLDARAARDVWPSVDRRALERAFQSLKSQELQFDRCSLTVTGARAQAACKGRATYVPRIGDQSPRFTAREWTFELRKADERWTIASARTL